MSNKNRKYRHFNLTINVAVEVEDGMTREEFEVWHWDKIQVFHSPTEKDKKISVWREFIFNNLLLKNKIKGSYLQEVENGNSN
jgi:hypothetical protein